MSLLDNASLLLTPNGYKEGKLYSVIPSNGNGDFTATRATTATRVNAAGLVDLVPYNLVQYSEMFSNAAWPKVNLSVSANTTTAPDGLLTADTLSADGILNSHLINQTFTFNSGTTYTVSFYIKKSTNNFVQLYSFNTTGGQFANFDINSGVVGTFGTTTGSNPTSSIQSVGNGWYRCSMTFTAAATASSGIGLLIVTSASAARLEANSLNTSVFLWGAQIVEGTSARDYLRTETRLNIPRLDYSLGGCPNILLEPQRTNLALQSSSFDSASWTKATVSITANTTTSPSGIIDADTLTGDGTLNIHTLFQGFTVTNGINYSWSFYAKKNTNNFIQLNGSAAGFGVNVWANFDLNNGVVGSVGLSTTASIQSVGNGWYRCTIVGAAIASTSTNINLLLVSSAASIRGESNTLSTSVFLWGAQLEAGAYATSYIPTTTASVTRNADSITRNNIFTNGMITAAGGTWFVELRNNRVLVGDTSGDTLQLGVTANVSDNCIRLNSGTFASRITIFKRIGGVTTNLFTTTTDNVKLAFKWNGSTMDIFQNGVKVVSATSFTETNMQFLTNNVNAVPKYINEMALFPTPLTDAQLIQLTTL